MKCENTFFAALLAGLAILFGSASAHATGQPITPNQCGSFKPTGKLVMPASTGAILITASDASSDLSELTVNCAKSRSRSGGTVTSA